MEAQAQSSPLPWSLSTRKGNIIDAEENNVATQEANAKLIVASVNHAQALADVLRDIMNEFAESDNDAPHLKVWKQAQQALAAWKEAQ